MNTRQHGSGSESFTIAAQTKPSLAERCATSHERTLDVDAFLTAWLQPLASGSQRQYRQAVRYLARGMGLKCGDAVRALLAMSKGEAVVLLESWAARQDLAFSTRQQRVGAVTSLLRYAERVGVGGPGPVQVRVSGDRRAPKTRATEAVKVRALLAELDATPGLRASRDAAIISVLASLGLRRSECASLRVEKVDWEGREVMVLRKGGQWEALELPEGTVRRMTRWKAHLSWEHGPLWAQISRCGGFLSHAGLTADSIAKMTVRHGIGTPHDIRRMAGRWAVKHGGENGTPADVESLRAFLGHRSLSATVAYTRAQGDGGGDVRRALDRELAPKGQEGADAQRSEGQESP